MAQDIPASTTPENDSPPSAITLKPEIGGVPCLAAPDKNLGDRMPPVAACDGDLPRDFGRYRLEKKLGQGGMGAVYLAHDTELRRSVALKIPSRMDSHVADSRFRHEARAAAALSHPNICPIYDVGEVNGVPYLTMAFIQGDPLARRIDPSQPFEVAAAAKLVFSLSQALHYAHERGILHRDLKPANIMIDERGEPVIMDFGLARLEAATPLTENGQVFGTPPYMSPEQINGQVDAIGPASDIYSVGVILYQLLTGRLPFTGDLLALVAQVSLDEPPPPSTYRPGLDREMEQICLRALAKRPGDRWASMSDFARALASWLARWPNRPADAGAGPAPATPAFVMLRVEGTSIAYRPAPGQQIIAVGRQKRKMGEPDDQGNDLVLRVPGNDRLSARISRRHLEVRRVGDGVVAVDLSKAGTLLNGRPMVRGVPTPLAHGDRLVIAGAVTLAIEAPLMATRGPARSQAECPGRPGAAPLVLEATLGDIITLE